MRRASKVDMNQPDIVAELRRKGATVETLHRVGGGCPDLLVGYQGNDYVLEVKMPGESLNAKQRIWHEGWAGRAIVVRTKAEALAAIGWISPCATGMGQ